MADQMQEASAEQGQDAVVNDVPTLESLQEELKKKDDLITSIKSAQQGVDKANTELRQEVEGLRNSLKEKMTVEEKEKYEKSKLEKTLSSMQEELKSFKEDSQRRQLAELKKQILKDNDLNDFDLLDIISGDTVETFTKNVALYKEKYSKLVSQKMSGLDPQKGNTPNGSGEMSRADFEKLSPEAQRKAVLSDKVKII